MHEPLKVLASIGVGMCTYLHTASAILANQLLSCLAPISAKPFTIRKAGEDEAQEGLEPRYVNELWLIEAGAVHRVAGKYCPVRPSLLRTQTFEQAQAPPSAQHGCKYSSLHQIGLSSKALAALKCGQLLAPAFAADG